MSTKNKIVGIIENAIDDFGSKWSSHNEKSAGISEYADQILQLEVPDRESELIEMLEEGIAHLNNFHWNDEMRETYYNWASNSEHLIQSVKQPK